jgi:DNA-binding beta-propeller fold protein YncE
LALACTDGGGTDDSASGPAGLAVLGSGTNSLASVLLETWATDADGLNVPRDVEFNPDSGNLWVVNYLDDSVVILEGPGTDGQTSVKHGDSSDSNHFLAKPSSLAFNDIGGVATAHEEDERTQGSGPNSSPEDFMGPTLWTSNEDDFRASHSSHLDMMHNSPNAAGIAWEVDNRFWVFDGYHNSITMYDFHADHQLGGTDHTDGELLRYVEDEVGYVSDVPAHVAFDHDTSLLYIADTANNRIAVLDTTTGEKGSRVPNNYDGGTQYYMDDADLSTLIEGADFDMERPSGLELHDGMLWVTDNATGAILAFDLDGGLIDWLDTELPDGCLMGIALDDDGDLWFVDAVENEVVRIQPG